MTKIEANVNQTGLQQMNNEAKYAPWIAFVRIYLGIFWLYEVIIGHNWKVGHPEWTGAGAGEYVTKSGLTAIENGTWEWFSWMWTNIMIPQAPVFSYFVIVLQLALGIAFIFGIFARPFAILALGLDFSIFMLGNSRIPPFFTIGHIFVITTNAGMYYGLDGMMMSKLESVKTSGAKFIKSLINVNILNDKTRPILIASTLVLAIYYLLKIPTFEAGNYQQVSLDLAFMFALVTYALYNSKVMDKLAVATTILRVFIGYKFLHEIFARPGAALNGLPGWSNKEELTGVLNVVVEKHWGIVSSIVDTIFIPAAGFWAIVFAIVQTLVGVMLITGWKTRLAAKIGLVFLGILIIIGFTRLTPFVFGYMVGVLALNSGRVASFDSVKNSLKQLKIGIRISPLMVMIFTGIAIAAWIAAIVSGMEPDGYKGDTMGGFMASFVGIFAGLFAFTGYLQNRKNK